MALAARWALIVSSSTVAAVAAWLFSTDASHFGWSWPETIGLVLTVICVFWLARRYKRYGLLGLRSRS